MIKTRCQSIDKTLVCEMILFSLGCGASCVYPLLGTKKNGWLFLTSEADSMNFQFAKRNVEQNSLTEQIRGKTSN